ncbi:MAG: Bacterial extracellular solute-binding protein [Candidatus Izimaplasma bacterium HR2]|nr:MAG: Bacterial extracellular solute-binding protein [Candidatus Izimaplasma bacterium HR2]
MKKAKLYIVILVITISSVLLFNLINSEKDFFPEFANYELISVEGTYSAFINEHKSDYIENKVSYQIDYEDFNLAIGEVVSDGYFDWSSDTSITTYFEVNEEGLYLVYFDYVSITETHMPVTMDLTINGEKPYEELNQIILDTLWTEDNSEFNIDRYGNDVFNEQSIYEEFLVKSLRDSERLYEDGLYIYLESGVNELVFNKSAGHIKIKSISIGTQPEYGTYDEYMQLYSDKPIIEMYSEKIEVEDTLYKNSSTIIPGINRDPLVEPFSLTKLKLNVLGTDTYDLPGDSVTWMPSITKAGLYNLTFKVNQNTDNRTMYRTLYINNKIPYDEAKHLVFEYSNDWNNISIRGFKEEPLMIYLEPGDTITLEVDGTLFNSILVKLDSLASEIAQLGLDITKLTKNNSDQGIDWDIPAHFPTVEADLSRWIDDLNEINDTLRTLFGYEDDSKIMKDFEAAILKIKIIQDDVNELPRRLTAISTGSSSALQLITNQTDIIKSQSMIIDALYIHSNDVDLEDANPSFVNSFLISVQRFFLSFIDTTYLNKADEYELEVWVNRSRQFTDIIQQLADSDFTEETGISVKVSLIKDDSKLLLSNSANQQPDIAMGVSAWIPIEYGMRGMLYDMREADNYLEILSIYNQEQLVPMVYDDHLYGLPETQNFYVLFYRKDIIVDQLGLEVPSTWDDVINILPILNRNGMSYYIPLSSSSAFKSFDSTAPFIYQFGGSIYAEDGFTSAIDEEESIEALEFMTDLYLEYGTPVQTSSFFNEFRNGTAPIGIGDFGMYLQLINAASDIRGLWDIAIVPGVETVTYNKDLDSYESTINRSMPGAQQSTIIFEKSDKKDEAWEFLSWWMSTETQVKYSERLLNTLGSQYIWNSANMEAFSMLRIDLTHKVTILEQWEHLKEVPKIPGSYIIEREISNVWNNVVYNDVNLRSSISEAKIKIDKEVTRKMQEFEYIDSQGNVIRTFILPNKEDIKKWFGGE